jgi:hypothetical protein
MSMYFFPFNSLGLRLCFAQLSETVLLYLFFVSSHHIWINGWIYFNNKWEWLLLRICFLICNRDRPVCRTAIMFSWHPWELHQHISSVNNIDCLVNMKTNLWSQSSHYTRLRIRIVTRQKKNWMDH